ncbi:MAG: TetR/AcrR family transcriptional regulator [Opitutaceae bacterium]
MKSKGESTRRRIVEQTAGLLNTRGYLGTPVSEIMRVTGMQKGGIYNHFESRNALTLEAFDYGAGQMRALFRQALEGEAKATDKLLALFAVFRAFPRKDMPLGGCPIMNLAVESDHADPELRATARKAMERLIGLLERVIARGIARKEFAKGNARSRASLIMASLEGGVMLSNLYKDCAHLDAVLDHLERQVKTGFQ